MLSHDVPFPPLTAGWRALVLLLAFAVPAWAAPVNDHFAYATAIGGLNGTQSGSTATATSEAGEPLHAGELPADVRFGFDGRRRNRAGGFSARREAPMIRPSRSIRAQRSMR